MRSAKQQAIWLRLYWRTLLYYSICFFIPFIIVTWLLLGGSYALMYRDKVHSIATKSTALHKQLLVPIQDTSNIAYQLVYHPSIIPTLLENNVQQRIEIIRVLKANLSVSALYSDLFVFFPNLPYQFFSTRGSLNIDILSMYIQPDPDYTSIAAQLSAIQSPLLLPSLENNRTFILSEMNNRDILFIRPVKYPVTTHYLTFLTLLNREEITHLVKQNYNPSDGIFVLLNSGQRVVYSYGSDTTIDLNGWASSIDYSNSPYNFSQGNVSYLVFHDGASGSLLNTAYIIDQNTLKSQILRDLYPLIYGIVLIGVLGILLTTLIAYKTYRPMAKLKHILQSYGNHPQQSKDELVGIIDSVQGLLSEKNEAGLKIKQVTEIVQKQILEMLLSGNFNNTQDFSTLFSAAMIDLPGPLYTALSIHLPGDLPELALGRIAKTIEQDMVWKPGSVYCLIPEHETTIAMLASLPVGLDVRIHQEHLTSILRATLAKLDLDTTVGIGKTCDKLTMLGQSYLEACKAFEDRNETVTSVFFYSDSEPIQSTNEVTTGERYLRLADLIKKGNSTEALRCLNAILITLQGQDSTEPMGKIMLVRLLDAIGDALVSINYWDADQLGRELSHLFQLGTTGRLRPALLHLVENASLFAMQDAAQEGIALLRSIQEYIGEHAYDPMFNLNLLAMETNQPSSTLSRIIKKHIGMTFVDYISLLRMKRAKQLLLTTNMKLKDIVEAIGYIDIPNFIRKFKLLEGVTPGDYRKLNKNQVSESE